MHPLSQIRRGYNQAELLADRLGRQLGIPVCHNLRKHRWTPKQISLNLDARHNNLRRAFKAQGYPGDHVALVDDVMTTGTTVTTLTELLLRQGCRRVDVWVLARTP
jgi:ComF family protein